MYGIDGMWLRAPGGRRDVAKRAKENIPAGVGLYMSGLCDHLGRGKAPKRVRSSVSINQSLSAEPRQENNGGPSGDGG